MAIKVSGTTVIDDDRNINNVGIFTSTEFSGSGSGLTNISSIETNTIQSIASGTLPDGSPVVVNSDGTVSAVGLSPEFEDVTSGQSLSSYNYPSATFDSNSNKVVVAYERAGARAVVGTVTGDTISFGTEVLFANIALDYVKIVFDSSTNRVVIAYRDDSNLDQGTAIVGQVSGNSINFGSSVVFETNEANFIEMTFDSNTNRIVIAYQDDDVGDRGRCVVGEVDGVTNSISFGTPVDFENLDSFNTCEPCGIVFHPQTNDIFIGYVDGNNASRPTVIRGTVTGGTTNTITFQTKIAITNYSVLRPTQSFSRYYNMMSIVTEQSGGGLQCIAFTFIQNADSNDNKIAYQTVLGYPSGTNTMEFSSVYEIAEKVSSGRVSVALTWDSNLNKLVFVYQDRSQLVFARTATPFYFTAPSLAFDQDIYEIDYYGNGYVHDFSATFDSNSNKVIIGVQNKFIAFPYKNVCNLTEDNFIGFSKGSYTDGQTATIQTFGAINDTQTGLSTASKYYVTREGEIRRGNDFFGNVRPLVVAGTAISSNKIIVKG